MDAPESRGARLLRELERAYRALSPEHQSSVRNTLREGCLSRIVPSEAPTIADAAAGAA